MGYQKEYATYQPVRRLAQSPHIQAMLSAMQVPLSPLSQAVADTGAHEGAVPLSYVAPSDFVPDAVVSIDGSLCSIELGVGGSYGYQAACLTVVAVHQDQSSMRALSRQRPVEPALWQATRRIESVELALPGPGLSAFGERPGHPSFRRAVYEALDSLDLLSTYEALLAYKPQGTLPQRSPYEHCRRRIVPKAGTWHCECADCAGCTPNAGHHHCLYRLYSTDALRVHERLYPSSYETAYSETLMVLERIWLVHLLRQLEAKGRWHEMARTAWITDGPLAVYGSPSWISQAIMRELSRINTRLLVEMGEDLLLIGVEKSGTFVRHLEQIAKGSMGAMGAAGCISASIPRGGTLLLDDQYIKKRVLGTGSAQQFYGRNHYFGRRLFYRTRRGTLVSAMLPMLFPRARDLSTAHPPQFPRLNDALAVLDSASCDRYPHAHALTPLTAAHAHAAIPAGLGSRVLGTLARELAVSA